MKIATRVVLGYAVLVVLLAAALAYHAFVIRSIQQTTRYLSTATANVALPTLDLLRQRDLIDEYCRKMFATGHDPGYRAALLGACGTFEEKLERIRAASSSAGGREAIRHVTTNWISFEADLGAYLKSHAGSTDVPPVILGDLDRLSASVEAHYRGSLDAIRAAVERARAEADEARRLSWVFAAAALAASTFVSFLLVRSVSRPLKRLTAGTKAIAGGDFGYRLAPDSRDEFHRLASDFNAMARRLEELDQLKKDFVSHVSHEMKGPLASMRETTELLLEEIPGTLVDRQRRLLELNLKSNRRLTSMIENLLDLSRMEAGVMEYDLRRHDIAGLVRAAVAEFEVPAHERGIELRSDLPPEELELECDGDRIVQVVSNLLGNALKFSPAPGEIRIRVALETPRASDGPAWRRGSPPQPGPRSFVAVEVADRGPGVPETEKLRIFEKFHRARPGGKRAGEGTGLGLAICRTIVEAHGGSIRVEDNPGGGSIFRILIPAEPPAGDGRRAASSPI